MEYLPLIFYGEKGGELSYIKRMVNDDFQVLDITVNKTL